MLIGLLALAHSDAFAQTLTVEYQQTVTRRIEGATAAFSLDPSRVSAAARNGDVTLVGRGPGSTHVIVAFSDHFESFQVSVNEPPTIALPGMAAPDSLAHAAGQYDVRYGSDPAMLQGGLRFSRREGDRTTEFSLGGATPFADAADAGGAPFSVPLASYTVRTPAREITLLDRVVTNSPLTVSRSTVRGLHLREGPWQVHAGYSFFATFENLLLPTNKETVAGVGYRHRLTPRSSLTPNLYYFGAATATRPGGPLGTLLYEAVVGKDVKVIGELGFSRTVGGALGIDVDRPDRRLWGKVRFVPPELPSLTTEQQSRRQVDGGWTRHGTRLSVNANISSRGDRQGPSGYSSSVAGVDVQYRATRLWTIHGGPGYSAFDTVSRPQSRINSVTLPVGAQFSRANIGVGADYQFSRETNRDLAGHLVRASMNGALRDLRFTLHGERRTHAPSASYILSEVPGLQQVLDRLGITASTPEQLAALLRTNAELSAYGYANNVTIDVTPIQIRWGASAAWSGSRPSRPQLFLSTLFNRDQLIDRTSRSAVHTLSYAQKLGSATEVFSNWSVLCRDYARTSPGCRSVMSVSLRQTLNRVPRALLPQRQGHIQGTVFRDHQGRGVYSPGLPALAGVEVVLDGTRRSRTDAAGRFRFGGVPYGRHRVQVLYSADEPFFFTTPSPVDVHTDETVDFGIGLMLSSLRGVVRNDAGHGVRGVLVHISNAERQATALTTDDGTFAVQGLPAATYDVTLDAGSVPAGYPLDRLEPQRVVVETKTPGHATFVIRPYRSITGRVRLFDHRSGTYVQLPGAAVELRPLLRQATTNASGFYLFRDLPFGDHTLMVTYNGHEYTLIVRVPDGPALMKDVDITVVPADSGHSRR